MWKRRFELSERELAMEVEEECDMPYSMNSTQSYESTPDHRAGFHAPCMFNELQER
jgi:hypothetical protein